MTATAGDDSWRLCRVLARVSPAEKQQLRTEAAVRRLSLSACAREIFREFFALREEMQGAVAAPGRPGAPQTGQLPAILVRTEERLAATIDARAAELGDWLQRLEKMVDRLVQLYLVHTPEVARELHADAVASAIRRYASYRQAVNEAFTPSAGDGLEGGGG